MFTSHMIFHLYFGHASRTRTVRTDPLYVRLMTKNMVLQCLCVSALIWTIWAQILLHWYPCNVSGCVSRDAAGPGVWRWGALRDWARHGCRGSAKEGGRGRGVTSRGIAWGRRCGCSLGNGCGSLRHSWADIKLRVIHIHLWPCTGLCCSSRCCMCRRGGHTSWCRGSHPVRSDVKHTERSFCLLLVREVTCVGQFVLKTMNLQEKDDEFRRKRRLIYKKMW